MTGTAILALADGAVFRGRGVGASGAAVGEVVFNTAMTGYQEILTDPSYHRQLVTLTCAHIGNTGVNAADEEAAGIQAAGLIVRDVPLEFSSWRADGSLPDYLRANGVVAIADVDTRELTRHIREHGAQGACIMTGADADQAIEQARAFPGLQGMDLAREVSCERQYRWTQPSWGRAVPVADRNVVVYDFGVKRNILRLLVDHGCAVTVVPAQTSAAEVMALAPQGVVLSNGPGDPEPCDYAIAAIRELAERRVPLFGICLGHQLLALASGARTTKMKFGHHGANHPVLDLATGRVAITSQNHGFAVDEQSLPAHLSATHRSLFDGTLQGIARSDCPAIGFQGHPEASPGPHDLRALFERFRLMMASSEPHALSAPG